jgi:uncharacterized protein (DUF433 family)
MNLVIETKPPPLEIREDGAIMVAGTRIPLDTIARAYLNGETAEEIADAYDTLDIADVYTIIGYYLDHKTMVDQYLRRREREAVALRQTLEAQFPAAGLRGRLLARRHAEIRR